MFKKTIELAIREPRWPKGWLGDLITTKWRTKFPDGFWSWVADRTVVRS